VEKKKDKDMKKKKTDEESIKDEVSVLFLKFLFFE
jgi:hypothetical protein